MYGPLGYKGYLLGHNLQGYESESFESPFFRAHRKLIWEVTMIAA